jgi:hypothetical protein
MFGRRGAILAGVAGIVLLAAFTALRLDLRARITNIDESIPIAVSYAMYSSGRLDPNWARAELTPSLRYPQYNFYTYNIASHAVLKLMKFVTVDPLVLLRFANLAYQAIAIAAVVAALWNAGASAMVLWLAAALLTVAPALVHDAHMARPESFLYMLFGLAVLAATLPMGLVARASLVGAVVGIGTACKITFLATGLVFLPFLWPVSRQALPAATVAAAATVAGFAISAPYALFNFDVLMNGMRYLFAQYASAHPPHSLLEPSVLGSLAWTAEFLLKLYGPLIPAALILPLFWLRSPLVIGLWLSALAVILYFAPKPVLFERNLSLGIFAAAVVLAVLAQRSRLALACALLALLPMTWWSWQIAASNTRRFNTFAAAHLTQPAPVSDAWQADLANCRGRILLRDYGDQLSARLIARAASDGHQIVARYHSRFEALPASTLQAYIDSGHVLLRCKE